MKFCKRFFSLLLCLVLFFGCLSVPVNAEELELPDFYIYQQHYVTGAGGNKYGQVTGTVYPQDSETQYWEDKLAGENLGFTERSTIKYVSEYNIKSKEKYIITAGGPVTLKLNNFYDYVMLSKLDGSASGHFVHGDSTEVSCYFSYDDGTIGYGTGTLVRRQDGNFDVQVNFTPERDIVLVNITLTTKIPTLTAINYATSFTNPNGGTGYSSMQYFSYGEAEDNMYQVTIDQETKEQGLLSGIIGWLKNLFDGISDGFKNLGNKISELWGAIVDGFANLGNKIGELWTTLKETPSKIWELIETGLTNLFLPDKEWIEEFQFDFDRLMSDKLGAVWQVKDVVFESWDKVMEADEINKVNMPEVTIPIGNKQSFTFGGYEVQVVPDGFETVISILKVLVGIISSFAFVNGLRRRYDEVMGVEM